MSAYTDIEVEIDEPVALFRLKRPEKLNAFTHHALAELRSAVDAAEGASESGAAGQRSAHLCPRPRQAHQHS